MRADRLLAIVDLLRRHGRMSAAELARRLEVTPRTVMRDLDSLSTMGVPVYSERGRAGGYRLLPGFRPPAEDLTAEETRALLLPGGPGVAEALGLGDTFARAVRRLASGLPESHLREVGELLDRLVIDPRGWGGVVRHPAALGVVFDAVQQDRRIRVDYRSRGAERWSRRTLDPYGLVLGGSTWYLLAAHRGRPRTYRISRMQRVEVLAEAVRRPAQLDLQQAWQQARASWRERPSVPIDLRVVRGQLELVLGGLAISLVDEPQVLDDDAGHVLVRARVTTLRGAVGVLLGFGGWVEALGPTELRELMVSVAREVLTTYDG